jgi:hypothetical protein
VAKSRGSEIASSAFRHLVYRPIRREEVSVDQSHRVSGIEDPKIDRELAKLRVPIFPISQRKRKSREGTVGADFPIGK